jgi:hypothetical protein
MGMSFFPSRHRCCPACSERKIKVQGEELIEYYHRGVVCHLVGFDMALPLDVELIQPGEGEIIAAKRLLERVLGRYGRFIDGVIGDALYFEAPFFNFCIDHGKHVVAVIKGDQRALLQDAQGLFAQMKPGLWDEPRRLTQFWDAEGFSSAEGVKAAVCSMPMRPSPNESVSESNGPKPSKIIIGGGQPPFLFLNSQAINCGRQVTADGMLKMTSSTRSQPIGRSITALNMIPSLS